MTNEQILKNIINVTKERFDAKTHSQEVFIEQVITDLWQRGLIAMAIEHRGSVK